MRANDLESSKECVVIEILVSDNFNLLIGNCYFAHYFYVAIDDNYICYCNSI
jgi:hypothetical protein